MKFAVADGGGSSGFVAPTTEITAGGQKVSSLAAAAPRGLPGPAPVPTAAPGGTPTPLDTAAPLRPRPAPGMTPPPSREQVAHRLADLTSWGLSDRVRDPRDWAKGVGPLPSDILVRDAGPSTSNLDEVGRLLQQATFLSQAASVAATKDQMIEALTPKQKTRWVTWRSVVPGIGTAIGAAAGGVLGSMAGDAAADAVLR